MGNFFFNKQYNKPFWALSLAISATLHVTGLYILFQCPSILFSATPLLSESTVSEKEEENSSISSFFDYLTQNELQQDPISNDCSTLERLSTPPESEKIINTSSPLPDLFLYFKNKMHTSPTFSLLKGSLSTQSQHLDTNSLLDLQNNSQDTLNSASNTLPVIKKIPSLIFERHANLDLLYIEKGLTPSIIANQPAKRHPQAEKIGPDLITHFVDTPITTTQISSHPSSSFFSTIAKSSPMSLLSQQPIKRKTKRYQYSQTLEDFLYASYHPLSKQMEKECFKKTLFPSKQDYLPKVERHCLATLKPVDVSTLKQERLNLALPSDTEVVIDKKNISLSKLVLPCKTGSFEIERIGALLSDKKAQSFISYSFTHCPSYETTSQLHLERKSIEPTISPSYHYPNFNLSSEPSTFLTLASHCPPIYLHITKPTLFIADSSANITSLPYIQTTLFFTDCKIHACPQAEVFTHSFSGSHHTSLPTAILEPFSSGKTNVLSLKIEASLPRIKEGYLDHRKLYIESSSCFFQPLEMPPFNNLVRAEQIIEIPHLVLKDLFITKDFLQAFSSESNEMHAKAVLPKMIDHTPSKLNFTPSLLLSQENTMLVATQNKKQSPSLSFEKPFIEYSIIEDREALTLNNKIQPITDSSWSGPFQEQTLKPVNRDFYPSDLFSLGETPIRETESYNPWPSLETREIATQSLAKERRDSIAEYEKTTLTKGFVSPSVAVRNASSSFGKNKCLQVNEKHLARYDFSTIPTADSFPSLHHTDHFETEIKYKKRQDGEGYLFEVTLHPNKETYFSKSQQNFLFIIDKSSSIESKRYHSFKEGVKNCLRYLKEGDSFNIFLVDSAINSFKTQQIPWTPLVIKEAKSYLNSDTYRGFSSLKNPLALFKELTPYFSSDKKNTLIFMSDGNSLESINKSMEAFATLTKESQGEFSIFTASSSVNNNLPMLDLVSTFNGGEMMYSQTNASFPRKLALFVKHIENFIAGDIRVHTIDVNGGEPKVEFYPNHGSFPSLYSDRSYKIYGIAENLDDFNLILQGRSGENYISIRKDISFKGAQEGGKKLERNFAHQQAYVCYDYYLKKGDPFFLLEAERLLSPHAIPLAVVR